jgi:membrane protein required for colicin V production
MSWLDIAILVVVGLGALVGWRMGIIRGLFATVGVLAGMVLAGQLGEGLGSRLDFVNNPNGARVLGFVIVFGLTLVAASVLSSFSRGLIRLFPVRWVDGVGGAALGAAAGSMGMAVLVITAGSFPFGPVGDAIDDSDAATFLAEKAPFLLNMLPEEYQDVLSYVVREVETPRADLVEITATASTSGVSLALELVLRNPNPFGGAVQRLDYRVSWDRDGETALLVESAVEMGERLKAQGEMRVTLIALVEGPRASELARRIGLEGGARLEAEGQITIAFRTGTVSVPFLGTMVTRTAG